MSCACDDGVCDFSTSKHLRARKEHRCAECRGPIAKGETYERFTQKWEGVIESNAICAGCRDWTRAFIDAARAAKADCDCWVLGAFWSEALSEFTREVLGYDPETGAPLRIRGAA